ncbi:MAG TPA: glycosyltransferase [Thermoplasmata archaeon]|nr:glycosyltransferase [Thermoplasmata archaeon]
MTERRIRVLHAPANPAGQATTISRAQRELGIESDVLVFNKNVFAFDVDIDLRLDARPWGTRYLAQLRNFFRCARKYDVFHFHFGRSLLPKNIDLSLLRIMGKKTLMQYWGSDIIQIDVAKKYTLLSEETLKQVIPGLNDEKQRKKIAKIKKKVGASIVGDFSLLPFAPDSKVIRQALDVSDFTFVGCEPKRENVSIVHAPTNRLIKGTGKIIAAVERLKKDGYKVDLIIVENMPHGEAIEAFKKADIVVDDVLQGPYGLVAIECMALGKPVLGRIDENFAGMYKDLPIVNTNPDNLYENLKTLVLNPQMCFDLGKRGRAYVEANHDAKVIAQQLIDLYKSL